MVNIKIVPICLGIHIGSLIPVTTKSGKGPLKDVGIGVNVCVNAGAGVSVRIIVEVDVGLGVLVETAGVFGGV